MLSVDLIPPSGIGNLSQLWLSCLSPLGLMLSKILIAWLSNLSILSIHDEGYSRNVSCALDIYVFFIY